LADATVTQCDVSQAPAAFAGTVTNPADSTQTYRIYVSVLAAGATVGVTQVDVPDVAPGAEQTWSGSLKVSADNAQCVLRVERAAIA
jgi:hypothetical protein